MSQENSKTPPNPRLDVTPAVVESDLTELGLIGDGGGTREDPTPVESIRAVLREGRDSVLSAADIDPDEDNRAPGVTEQP
jgi:hypothetical protein